MQQGSSRKAENSSRRSSNTCLMSSSSTTANDNNSNKDDRRTLTAVLSEDGISSSSGSLVTTTMQRQHKQSTLTDQQKQASNSKQQATSAQNIKQSFLSKLTRAESNKQQSCAIETTCSKNLNQCDNRTSSFSASLAQQQIIPRDDFDTKETNTNEKQTMITSQDTGNQQTKDNVDNKIDRNHEKDNQNQSVGIEKEVGEKDEEDEEDDDDNLVIPAWPSRSDTLGHKKSQFVQHKVYSLKDYSQVANPSNTAANLNSTTTTANSSSTGNKLLKSMSQDRKLKISAKRMSECIYPAQNVLLATNTSATGTDKDRLHDILRPTNNAFLPYIEAACTPNSSSSADLNQQANKSSITDSANFSMLPGGTGLLVKSQAAKSNANARYANVIAAESKIDRMRKLFVSPLSLRSSDKGANSSTGSLQNKQVLGPCTSQQQQQHQHQHQGRLSFQSSIAMAGMLNKPHHMIHAMYSGRQQAAFVNKQANAMAGFGGTQSTRRSPMRKGQKGNVKSFRVYGCPLQMANNIYPITCFGRPDIYKQQSVPYVLARLCNYIEENSKHLTHEGIFRVSGNARLMEKLRTLFDRLGDAPLESESVDVATSASMLKMYLRELPEPLIPTRMNYYFITLAKKYALYLNSLKESNNFNNSYNSYQQQQQSSSSSNFLTKNYSKETDKNYQGRPSIQSTTTTCGESSISSHSFHSDQSSNSMQNQQLSSIERQRLAFSRDLTKLLRKLPIENYNLLKYLACFLFRISLKQQYNKMCAEALGIVFGPNVFRIRSESYKGLKEQELTNQIMASIISNYKSIFDSELTDPLGNLVLENNQQFGEQKDSSPPSSTTITTTTPSLSATATATSTQQQQQQQLPSTSGKELLAETLEAMEVDKFNNENITSSIMSENSIKIKHSVLPAKQTSTSGCQNIEYKHSSCCPEHCQGCLLDHEPTDLDFNPSSRSLGQENDLNESQFVYDNEDDVDDDEEDEVEDEDDENDYDEEEDDEDIDEGEEEGINSDDCDFEDESYTPTSGSGSYCSSMNSETLESSDYDEENGVGQGKDDGVGEEGEYVEGNKVSISFNRQDSQLRERVRRRGGGRHHHHHHHHNDNDTDYNKAGSSSSGECPSDTSYTPTSSHTDENGESDLANGEDESINYNDDSSSSTGEESLILLKRDQNKLESNLVHNHIDEQRLPCLVCKTESSTQTPIIIPKAPISALCSNLSNKNQMIESKQKQDANKEICDINNEQEENFGKENNNQQEVLIPTLTEPMDKQVTPSSRQSSFRGKQKHDSTTKNKIITESGKTRKNQQSKQEELLVNKEEKEKEEGKQQQQCGTDSIETECSMNKIQKSVVEHSCRLSLGKQSAIKKNLQNHYKNSMANNGKLDFMRARSSSASSLGRMKRRERLAAVAHQQANRKGQAKGSSQHSSKKSSTIKSTQKNGHNFNRTSCKLSSLQSGSYSARSSTKKSHSLNTTSSKLTSNNKQSSINKKTNQSCSKKQIESDDLLKLLNRKDINNKKAATTFRKCEHLSKKTNDGDEETLCIGDVSSVNLESNRLLLDDLGFDDYLDWQRENNYMEELESYKYYLLRSYNSDETLLHSNSYNEFEPELCSRMNRRFSGNDFLNVKQNQQLLPLSAYLNHHHQCEQIFESCFEPNSVLIKDFVYDDCSNIVGKDNYDEKFKTSYVSLMDNKASNMINSAKQLEYEQQKTEKIGQEGREEFGKEEDREKVTCLAHESKQSLLSINVTDNSSISFNNNQFEDIFDAQLKSMKDLIRLLKKIHRRINYNTKHDQASSSGLPYHKKESSIMSLDLNFQKELIQKVNMISDQQIQYTNDYTASSIDYLSAQSVIQQLSSTLREFDERKLRLDANELVKEDVDEDVSQYNYQEQKDHQDRQRLMDDILEFKIKLLEQRYVDLRKIREHYSKNHSTISMLKSNPKSTSSISGLNVSASSNSTNKKSQSDNKQIMTFQGDAASNSGDNLNKNDDAMTNKNIVCSITEQLTVRIIESAYRELINNEQKKLKQQQSEQLNESQNETLREKSKLVHDSYRLLDTPVTSSSSLSASFMRFSIENSHHNNHLQQQHRKKQKQKQLKKQDEYSEFRERKLSAPSSSGSVKHKYQRHRHSNDNNGATTSNQPSKSSSNVFYCCDSEKRERVGVGEEDLDERVYRDSRGIVRKNKANFISTPLRASDELSSAEQKENRFSSTIVSTAAPVAAQLDFLESSAASSQQYLATSCASGGSCFSLHEVGSTNELDLNKANIAASEEQDPPSNQIVDQASKNNLIKQQPSLYNNRKVVRSCKYGSLCPIEFVYNIEKQLALKRVSGGRLIKLNNMSMEQLLGEKLELQKNLLRYEHWFGRPLSKLDYSLVGHLYERYRAVKLIISAKKVEILS